MTFTIRHAEADDCAAITRIYDHPNAVAGTLQVPLPAQELWRQRLASKGAQDRILVAASDQEKLVVGALGLHPAPQVRRAHVAHLGMAVRDDWQGRGAGKAMLAAAIDLADQWLNLLRLELTVFTDNQAAIGLYQSMGFVIEGTHRAYALRHGQFTDTHAMARLHPAPPRLPSA